MPVQRRPRQNRRRPPCWCWCPPRSAELLTRHHLRAMAPAGQVLVTTCWAYLGKMPCRFCPQLRRQTCWQRARLRAYARSRQPFPCQRIARWVSRLRGSFEHEHTSPMLITHQELEPALAAAPQLHYGWPWHQFGAPGPSPWAMRWPASLVTACSFLPGKLTAPPAAGCDVLFPARGRLVPHPDAALLT